MENRQYAGFWIRGVALTIDWIVVGCASWILEYLVQAIIYGGLILGHGQRLPRMEDAIDPVLLECISIASWLSIAGPYQVIGTHHYRTTLGKKLMGLEVVDAETFQRLTWKQSVLRFITSGLSYIGFGAGLVMVVFNSKKRALHDALSGSACVYLIK